MLATTKSLYFNVMSKLDAFIIFYISCLFFMGFIGLLAYIKMLCYYSNNIFIIISVVSGLFLGILALDLFLSILKSTVCASEDCEIDSEGAKDVDTLTEAVNDGDNGEGKTSSIESKSEDEIDTKSEDEIEAVKSYDHCCNSNGRSISVHSVVEEKVSELQV